MNGYKERIRSVLALPLHRFVDIKSIEATEGRSMVELEVGRSTINPAGFLHGGVIYTLCDVAAYCALLSILPTDKEAVTHDIHVSVLRPVQSGKQIRFEAEVIKKGVSLVFIESSAFVDDTIIARAQITKTIL